MCNYHDKFIYVSGGRDKVVRFNIRTEMWEDVVSLNAKRSMHSSCVLKEFIYVVGGNVPNTIEKLDVSRLQSRWQVIEIAFYPGWRPIFSVINKHELLILNTEASFVFNSENGSLTQERVTAKGLLWVD